MRILAIIGVIILILTIAVVWMAESQKIPARDSIEYGVTYSVFRSNELGLDWKHVYDALIDDLKVRKFRFVAHWDLTDRSASPELA